MTLCNTEGVLGNTNQNTQMAKRSRGWCWTLNNYSEAEYNKIKMDMHNDTVEKWIIGKEIGSKGTPHLQGYIYLKNARTFESMKKTIEKAHWESAKGKPDQNYNYCSKEGNFECNGFDAKHKPVKFGGYTSVEEQVQNTPMKIEIQMNLDDEAQEWIEKQEEVDETLDESWDTSVLDGYESD